MKRSKFLLANLVLACLTAVPAGGETKSNPAWEKMKSLVGTWEGTYNGKDPVSIHYKLVSNGTSLMESMNAPGDTDMITVYHPDGDRIMATHYCASGNQPRMRATVPAADVRTLDFQFVDVTNNVNPDGEVMRRLVVTFVDADHFKQEWTSRAKGKDDTGQFVFTRKK